jgi:uncharacterized protein (TIGR04222 family)
VQSSRLRRTALRLGLVGLLATVVLLLGTGTGPAGAQTAFDERITSFRSEVAVEDDGAVVVTEIIAYDFGSSTSHHGIERFVPTRVPYDDVKEGYDRVFPLDVLRVESDAPDQYETSTDGGYTRIRIGDPDQTVTGQHTYEIEYRIRGGLNHFSDHDELNYNVTGDQWEVPIDRVSATVTLPSGTVDRTTCFAGPRGSQLLCAEHSASGGTASFSNGTLGPGEGMTVVVAFPTGIVPTPEPILEERWTLQRAFAVRPNTVAPAAGLLAMGALGVGAVAYKVGRDRRYVGSPTDVAFGSEGLPEQSAPLRRGPIPVEFVPPDHLRPGQIGTLIDEQANALDVTATIVDLAVRGYLRIEEIPKEEWFGKADWRLVKQPGDEGRLLDYERTLYDALFATGDDVLLSSLKNRFATSLKLVQSELYDDAVSAGWFTRRPDATRNAWRGVGLVAVLAAVGITVLLAWKTSFGLVGIPLVLAAIVLFMGSRWMPRRTAKGYGALQRTLGFKRFIDESEKDRARFAEQQHLFSEYLPYAVVFGATDKWARAFSGLDGTVPRTDWYVGPHAFTTVAFASSMDGFTVTTAGTMASTPSSSGVSGFSGGGFSGGGAGGGGTGSW